MVGTMIGYERTSGEKVCEVVVGTNQKANKRALKVHYAASSKRMA